jgi:hypothetical protein
MDLGRHTKLQPNGGPEMTIKTMLRKTKRPTNVALVWIDHEHAVIVSDETERKGTVACLERDLNETETQFETRTVDRVADEEKVVVSGPASARTSFERVYVAVTHRPDRLVDIEPTVLGRQIARATA